MVCLLSSALCLLERETLHSRLKNLQFKCRAFFNVRCHDEKKKGRQQKLWGINEIDNDVFQESVGRKGKVFNCSPYIFIFVFLWIYRYLGLNEVLKIIFITEPISPTTVAVATSCLG